MPSAISTHLFLPQRLTPELLGLLRDNGFAQIEVFAARHHFDYTDRNAVKETADWFRSNDVAATMHMPLFSAEDSDEFRWTRHTAPSINLIHANKADRIAAMDEVKRALEAAEMVPFQSCVIHLGLTDETWDTRALDDSLTAVEHLKAFAGPLGVKLLLENLTNNVATPEHLVEIVRVGHFDSVGYCLDVGHAHLAEGLPETSHSATKSGIELAFEAFGDKIVEMHVHDNGGVRDEHGWPFEGTIDWTAVEALRSSIAPKATGVLEIQYDFATENAVMAKKAGDIARRLAELG